MHALPSEWRKWVDENVSRGVAPQTLIDILVTNKFDAAVAAQAVSSATSNQSESDNPQDAASHASIPYQYEHAGKYAGTSVKTADREVTILLKIDKPQVVLFGNVLSKEECEQLMALSSPKLERSTTVDDATGGTTVHDARTSNGMFFKLNENPFIAKLDHRIAQLMQVPVVNGEGLQILHYEVGGEFKPHFDYFPPDLPGSATHIAKGGQRTATLIVYLNTVPEGGETVLPEIGLAVAPVQGNALYFSYTNSLGQLDPLSCHGGDPVIRGEKWIATKWVREREYR